MFARSNALHFGDPDVESAGPLVGCYRHVYYGSGGWFGERGFTASPFFRRPSSAGLALDSYPSQAGPLESSRSWSVLRRQVGFSPRTPVLSTSILEIP